MSRHPNQGEMSHKALEPIGWTDRPKAVRRFFRTFFAVCVLLAVAEFAFSRHSEHPHPWEGLTLFYPLAGFISFWGLVLVAKRMRKLLIRAEDYYEPAQGASDEEEGTARSGGDVHAG